MISVDWLIDHIAIFMLVAMMAALFSGVPVGFILGGLAVLFGFVGWYFDVFSLIQFFNFLPRIWGGMVTNSTLIAIPMFILMGAILEKTRVAAELLNCLQILLRRMPGGLAISVVIMGTIMAATTGIVGASVTMLCFMAMPVMLKQGYSRELASGTIAASGTLGILLPPSVMLIIMADIMSSSVTAIFASAVVPSLLLSLCYVVFIMVFAWTKPAVAPPLPADEHGTAGAAFYLRMLKGFVAPMALVLVVLGSILGGWASPSESAGFGVLGAFVVAAMSGKMSWRLLDDALNDTIRTNGMVFFILLGATLYAYVFRALGGDDIIADLLGVVGITDGWQIVIFMMVLVFILGFFLDWIEICLIIIPLFLPLLNAAEFADHLGRPAYFLPWLATLLAVNLQTSFLTPPFGGALFFLKGAAPDEVTLGHIYRGIVPFVAIQLLVLAACILVPDLVLYLPILAGLVD